MCVGNRDSLPCDVCVTVPVLFLFFIITERNYTVVHGLVIMVEINRQHSSAYS